MDKLGKIQTKSFGEIDMDNMAEYFAAKDKIENAQNARIQKFIDSLSEKNFQLWVEKILKWEEKYQEYWYTERHIQTESNIFETLMRLVKANGTEMKFSESEMFLSAQYKWRGLIFQLYIGQGAFWRITKNKEVIFQST